MDKDMGNDNLFHVIRSTMKGYGIYSNPSERLKLTAWFTEKEIDVIRLICQGMARDEMAVKLGVSESMIKQHISSILDKTGFDSISKFAIYAVGEGIIFPGFQTKPEA
jgi:DNA-binding NarL/FixJ family response regulator